MRTRSRRERSLDAWIAGLAARDRAIIGEALTLVESTHPEDRARAGALVAALHVRPGMGRALRVGVSGAPGVGKSTLIERLGMMLVARGRRVGVLAIDPTSQKTGGSILGDKTRMPGLSTAPEAFVRPSPSGAELGGIAARTREAMVVFEAAGMDVVIVETVGVGQSEIAVRDLTDTFVLLVLPGAGDELQGIKRGIMEVADVVLVTKADGLMAGAAIRAATQARHALRLMPRDDGWQVAVLTVSALEGQGLDVAWEAVERHRMHLEARGDLQARRGRQAVVAFRRLLGEALDAHVARAFAAELAALEVEVAAGRVAEDAAALTALGWVVG
ncbi:MAG: methylmalonyl Co-A mutase-associated GTPase MeaB [Deltaproteobacteria bacterium]|nr:methylmalonyl Co-A mutase-associated GTPase MeaB [Deltaproteobacteria bacterium]